MSDEDYSSSSDINDSDVEDGHHAPTLQRPSSPPATQPASVLTPILKLAGREGTPPPPETGGSQSNMKRLLRMPRYFDADFELAAMRCFRCEDD